MIRSYTHFTCGKTEARRGCQGACGRPGTVLSLLSPGRPGSLCRHAIGARNSNPPGLSAVETSVCLRAGSPKSQTSSACPLRSTRELLARLPPAGRVPRWPVVSGPFCKVRILHRGEATPPTWARGGMTRGWLGPGHRLSNPRDSCHQWRGPFPS